MSVSDTSCQVTSYGLCISFVFLYTHCYDTQWLPESYEAPGVELRPPSDPHVARRQRLSRANVQRHAYQVCKMSFEILLLEAVF